MFAAVLALLWGVLFGHATVYGAPGTNRGVVVDVSPGHCVGLEIVGTPGWFGNVYGLQGGDCS